MTNTVPQDGIRTAESWINEVLSTTTTDNDAVWCDWDEDNTQPEGVIHVVLRNGHDITYILAQRLRWTAKDRDDDIVSWRYLTDTELATFTEAMQPSAAMAERASRFINEFYKELTTVNEELVKKEMGSATMALLMNFSLNCSLSESGTIANMSGSDMQRVAMDLIHQAGE